MKILLCNYRFFVSGGPERYMFNLTDELNAQGHETIPFSIKYNNNKYSSYENYFVDPLGNRDEILYRDQRKTFKNIYRTALRLFYDPEVERAVIRLINDTNPQIAYVLHYLRKLSPALLVGLKKMRIPIVVRLSDYGMVCPQMHCLRDDFPCDLCLEGDLLPSIKYRCVNHSLPLSIANALATSFHRWMKYFDLIDKYVVTNAFMYEMMVKAGFDSNRLELIETFVNPPLNISKVVIPGRIVYAGRIERIKGLHILLKAARIIAEIAPALDWHIKVAGDGVDRVYLHEISELSKHPAIVNRVELLGKLTIEDVYQLLSGAEVSVAPSLSYENLPNSVLESFVCGAPVIASNIGSLACMIEDGKSGFLVDPNDPDSLARAIIIAMQHSGKLRSMGENAIKLGQGQYSHINHVYKLESLFRSLI